jgi:hypothetical protein
VEVGVGVELKGDIAARGRIAQRHDASLVT